MYNKVSFTCIKKVKVKKDFQLDMCLQVTNEPFYIHMGWKKVIQSIWDIYENMNQWKLTLFIFSHPLHGLEDLLLPLCGHREVRVPK